MGHPFPAPEISRFTGTLRQLSCRMEVSANGERIDRRHVWDTTARVIF
jgi:hypothetical protein